MLFSSFDFNSLKDTLNSYGYIFAIVAAVLLLILIITIIAAAVNAGKLKRRNAELRARAESDEKKLADIARSLPTEPQRDERVEQTTAETAATSEQAATSESEQAAQSEAEEPQSETVETARDDEKTAETTAENVQAQPAREERESRTNDEEKSSAAAEKRTAASKSYAASKSAGEAEQNKYTVKYDRAKGNWMVIKNGNTRPTRRVATKAEALAIAKDLADASGASLVVHKKDGKFQKQ